VRRFKHEEPERRERNVRRAGAARPDDQSRVPILRLEDEGAPSACNPLADPLWADAGYRAAMRDLGMAPCPQARPWTLPPRP
jgi:hypothetical protein